MSIETTRNQFRRNTFKKIHKIIVENFGASIQNEHAKVNSFCEYEHSFLAFEILLEREFDFDIDLSQDPMISDILDLIWQD